LALHDTATARADAERAVKALQAGAGVDHPRTREAVAYLRSLTG